MIEVIANGHPVGQFKPWKWREGHDYCLRLVTIYTYQNSRHEFRAQPTYRPLFQFYKSKASIEIVLFLRGVSIVSYVGKRIHIQVINDSE